MVERHCLSCHSTEKQKGDLDLERFRSMTDIRRETKVWQGVLEQVSEGEMPPKDKPQPAAAERERLLDWVRSALDAIALERAGDPGPVVLRRLSNAEYTATLRDLTGVPTLDPAREFPADSASGEGFMNVGQSLVMSPTMVTKYLDAAKAAAGHAVLLPSGVRFSEKVTRRDWTEETLDRIRRLYGRFTDARGGTEVNLQGIRFDTNVGGRIPLERYLAALLDERETRKPSDAASLGLSAKYLALLRTTLNGTGRSPVLDPIRVRWRGAKPGEAAELAREITAWQETLWRFNPVGHIGKANGPKAWMEPVTPLLGRHEMRLKLPRPEGEEAITVYLVTTDAGDGSAGDEAVWERPRLVAPGRPEILLRDLRGVSGALAERRARAMASVVRCLEAASEADVARGAVDVAGLSRKHDIDAGLLRAWLGYLGIGGGAVRLDGHFTNRIASVSGYDFVRGWGSSETPSLLANGSDQAVRVPGNMKPRGVTVHPSPTRAVGVSWQSPVEEVVRVEARIQHAHPECGNGVAWWLELRRGSTRQRLAAGTAQGGRIGKAESVGPLTVREGDVIALWVGARDGNHSCDLTAVDLKIAGDGGAGRDWDLAADVAGDVLAANPHPDRHGRPAVWHFVTEPDAGGGPGDVIPAGSLLARWQSERDLEARRRLARELEALLSRPTPPTGETPDGALYRQFTALAGPLFDDLLRESGRAEVGLQGTDGRGAGRGAGSDSERGWGLDPKQFGDRAEGKIVDDASLVVRAPAVIEVRLPAALAGDWELVATGVPHPQHGREASVQFQVSTKPPGDGSGLVPSAVREAKAEGPWTSGPGGVRVETPIVANDGSVARRRIELALEEFRGIFPAALCYTKIVPVDEVVTLTLYHREDEPLARLMLSDTESAELDALWDELRYVSQDALTLVDAFEQLWQYATQDADPKVFEPLRGPIQARAAAFRRRLVETQPAHVAGVIDLADRAYRRPLTEGEKEGYRTLYARLRSQEVAHEHAVRLLIARVLVAPAFLYRGEAAGPGTRPLPVTDWELATRLSYFLWSSLPDAELREQARLGALQDPAVLVAQARRMMRDGRIRRMATEFGCAWLHIYDFDQLGEKSDRHFPSFTGLRSAMYEESIRFLTELVREDRSVLDLLNADYTYLNGSLAGHYGIPEVVGEEWRQVNGVKRYARGGILAQAATLAKHSGASRTSPILRGNWVAEVLLGEKLPRPPKDVPILPDDESGGEGLTVRQLVEKHSSDPKCYGCHARIDPYGYALEAYDAIGRRRERDLGDRLLDTRATALDGASFEGLDGLRDYLLTQRRDAFLRQFCRKLLGYSLGRAVVLSDRPLLDRMQATLHADGYRISRAIEEIVRSPQFRQIRGRDMTEGEP